MLRDSSHVQGDDFLGTIVLQGKVLLKILLSTSVLLLSSISIFEISGKEERNLNYF